MSATIASASSPVRQRTGAQTVVGVAFLISGAVAVSSLVDAISGPGLSMPLDLVVNAADIGSAVPDTATVIGGVASVDVAVGLGLRLAWWAVTDALALAVMAFLVLLRGVIADLDNPFAEANVQRMRGMTILAVTGATIVQLQPVIAVLIQDSAGFDGFEATWDFAPIIIAAAFGALTEVWRRGAAMRVELELTV